MNAIKKLKQYILPKQIDFFQMLSEQLECTSGIVLYVCQFYQNKTSFLPIEVQSDFEKAKANRQQALADLSRTFITPVDKEAISRLYFQLNRIVLKVKHLNTEIEIYETFDLMPYKTLLDLLCEEMNLLKQGFQLLLKKQTAEVHQNTDKLLHLSNEFSAAYAKLLNGLFEEKDIRKILETKEVLFQLKDINHTMVDANYAVEDILFKMN